jgi:hypothetical protein
MRLSPDGERSRTLGAYLSSLGPGDVCLCCGARLRASGACATGDRAVPCKNESQAGPGVVVCPACGCEVAEVATSVGAGALCRLTPAA